MPARKTATIILNRNLPKVADALVESFRRNSGEETDVFVVESGSSKENLSKHCTWWANSPESLSNGLRIPRGFNYGLARLLEEGRFEKYEYFFLVCNDAEFAEEPVVARLREEMERHPRLGILSPCAADWGERRLIGESATKYIWFIDHVALFLRRGYLESVMCREAPFEMGLLYDGSNFRGYLGEIELIAKGYANDWASGITTRVGVSQNQSHLRTHAALIMTDTLGENQAKAHAEGLAWMRRKYGFPNRWTMQMYSKFFYDRFFENYPELRQFKI